MRQLKALFSDMLVESNDELKIGCHLFWKTGYLFAVFGHAAHHLLMMSACHESEKKSMMYYNNAMTHFESHKHTPHPANNVSKWSPTLVSNPRNAHQMAILGGQKLVPPDQLGTHFVENILHVNPTKCKTMQGPLHLYQLAKNYLQKDTPQELY